MANFRDILITTDFDRTLTAPDTTIPKRNLDAIRYFIKNGGAFTVNTGRTLSSFRPYMHTVPVNAPLLLYNGSAAYEIASQSFVFAHEINLNWWEVRQRILDRYPMVWIEYQGADAHYMIRKNPMWESFCQANHYTWSYASVGDDLGPFLKFCIYGRLSEPTISHLFHGLPDEIRFMDEMEQWLRLEFANDCVVTRSADLYIDVQPMGVDKGRSALALKEKLGRKVLICVGDAENDLSMLDAADFAFCPKDAGIKDRYQNLCCCSDGALADLIYNDIPSIRI